MKVAGVKLQLILQNIKGKRKENPPRWKPDRDETDRF